MADRIRSLLQDLEQLREGLLALSDDIWLSIDHNDTEAMREGVAFKAQYNEKIVAFDRVAGELSALVQQFTQVKIDAEPAMSAERTAATERMIRDLDQQEPHTLDEDFTYKRPYGFTLGDAAQSGLVTWKRLYQLLCSHLEQRDPQRFQQLPDNPAFVSRRGHPAFSRDPHVLRLPMPLSAGLFAEANLSANHIRDQITLLLDEFGIDRSALHLYLRQDRDAESEAEHGT